MILRLICFYLLAHATTTLARDSEGKSLLTLEGKALVDGYYLNCLIDNLSEETISIKRVEYNYACGHPANLFHYRYRCEETNQDCDIPPEDYSIFYGPVLMNCYLIQPECLVRYKIVEK